MSPTGEATVTGTTVRRYMIGMAVQGKAEGKSEGCRITTNTRGGIMAIKTEEGPGELTVEAGAVCEGNTTNNNPVGGDFMSPGARSSASPRSGRGVSMRVTKGELSFISKLNKSKRGR